MSEEAKMSDVVAIKRFFEKDGDRQVTMNEMRSLSKEERAELGELARKELA